ncbi:MAG: hypothetical protein FWF53_10850 [Candidatus Azobacteroides sp.]|nr:hypothetical protein [Candidatus Azobacteroides sp.]
MKKEIKKTNFDISKFEVLDSKGNVLLKGGFSPVYDENLVFGGKSSPVVNNIVAGCGCTINAVAGCGCSSTAVKSTL